MAREPDNAELGKSSSNSYPHPSRRGAASSARLLGRVGDTRQRYCGRWSNCVQLLDWTGRTPISDAELGLFCAWLTFLGPSLPPLLFGGKACHNRVRLASAAFWWIRLAVRDSGACRPLIPIQGDHRFQCSGRTGRHVSRTGGRHGPERVVGIHRNPWSAWPGLCKPFQFIFSSSQFWRRY
jgi:hypothetical protein